MGHAVCAVDPTSPFRISAVTPLVTVGWCRVDPRHPQFASAGPARWTSFVFPRRAVRIVRSSRERFVETPNVVTFHNAGEEYGREAIDPAGDHADFFVLHAALLLPILEDAGLEPADPTKPWRVHRLRCDARCYLEQRRLTRYVDRTTSPDGLLVEETVVRLLERVLAREGSGETPPRAGRDGTAARRKALVERTQELLAARFRENLALGELAAAVAVSPAHLARIFHAETGSSIHRCRQELRLRAALELVAERPRELTDVALELGFSSHSHFTWAFRRAFEIAPSAFRADEAPRRRRDALTAGVARASRSRGPRAALRARS